MLSRRASFPRLILGVLYLVAMTGCFPISPAAKTSPRIPDIKPNSMNENLQVEVTWTYQDTQRFAVELSVIHYPLPQGFQIICPLTQLVIKNGAGESLLLYRNPEQTNLDEFYAISQHSRWLCKKQTESDGFADYLFSLTYSYKDEASLQWNESHTLSAELGGVIATNSGSMMNLPNQGTFDLPLDFETEDKNLTRLHPTVLINNGILVEINRVTVNLSFALLDTCIEYQDHHFWRPVAAILYHGQEAYSTDFIPTFPRYPFNRDTILESTRRCYSFIIPFDFPLESLSTFQIGIKRVEIVSTDAGVVTMQECESVKAQSEKEYPGLEIRCIEYKTRGQQQHWFEILSPPPGLSTQDAYELVKSAFTQVIPGPWYAEIP